MANVVAFAQPREVEQRAVARDRRVTRTRADRMQRALAGVELQIDGLRLVEQLVVLNTALSEKLRDAREAGVLAVEP
jgi:hypothetical protein